MISYAPLRFFALKYFENGTNLFLFTLKLDIINLYQAEKQFIGNISRGYIQHTVVSILVSLHLFAVKVGVTCEVKGYYTAHQQRIYIPTSQFIAQQRFAFFEKKYFRYYILFGIALYSNRSRWCRSFAADLLFLLIESESKASLTRNGSGICCHYYVPIMIETRLIIQMTVKKGQ